MPNRPGCVLAFLCMAVAASARPALAQHTLNVSFGHFMMRSEGRIATDILLIERHDLLFEVGDFNGATIGGEWLVPVGNMLEAGAGVSFTRNTVSTVHTRVRNRDGSEIPRVLSLRQLPFAFTVRVLPLGQSYRVQPYAGGGIAVVKWRYSESGDFVDGNGNIFRNEEHAAVGGAIGPLVLFGLRVSGETLTFGAEGRYHSARGSFGPVFGKVRDPDIGLSGWSMQATAGVRLGG